MSAGVLMAALTMAPMADATWVKVMMMDAAASDGAVCLDGTACGSHLNLVSLDATAQMSTAEVAAARK